MAEEKRLLISATIGFNSEDKNHPLLLTFNGIEWEIEGKLFPRDVQFLNKIVELVKEYKR